MPIYSAQGPGSSRAPAFRQGQNRYNMCRIVPNYLCKYSDQCYKIYRRTRIRTPVPRLCCVENLLTYLGFVHRKTIRRGFRQVPKNFNDFVTHVAAEQHVHSAKSTSPPANKFWAVFSMSEASSRATTKASRLVSSAAPKPRPGPHRTIPLPPRRAPHSPRTRPLRPTPPPARRAQPEPHFGLRPAAERPLRAFPGQPPARRTRLAIKPARIRSRMFHKNLPRPQSPILLFQASGGVKKYEPDLEWKADRVVGVTRTRSTEAFNTRWSGYDHTFNTNEPRGNLRDAVLVRDFASKMCATVDRAYIIVYIGEEVRYRN